MHLTHAIGLSPTALVTHCSCHPLLLSPTALVTCCCPTLGTDHAVESSAINAVGPERPIYCLPGQSTELHQNNCNCNPRTRSPCWSCQQEPPVISSYCPVEPPPTASASPHRQIQRLISCRLLENHPDTHRANETRTTGISPSCAPLTLGPRLSQWQEHQPRSTSSTRLVILQPGTLVLPPYGNSETTTQWEPPPPSQQAPVVTGSP
jgi:hypothetical protein